MPDFLRKNQSKKNAFTLIELLVVIAIIGILATIVLVSLNRARQKARDARRQSDIKQISLAMELYYDAQDPSAYPTRGAWVQTFTPIPDQIKSSLSPYLSDVPDDPVGLSRGYVWRGNNGRPDKFCIYSQSEVDSGVYFVASKFGTGRRNAAPSGLDDCASNL